MDLDEKQEFGFCGCCIQGSSHHLLFQLSTTKRSKTWYTVMYVKIGTKPLGGSEYLVIFLDDRI